MTLLKNIALILLLIPALFISCSESKEEEIPSGLIEKPVFTEMLLEMQLVEAHINEVRVNQIYIKDSANHFFQEVFEKHNKTNEEFSTTMEYYVSKPSELQEIYGNVLDRLSEMEAELADIKLNEEAISPVGKHMIADIISKTPVAVVFKDSSFTSNQVKDSLFKYLINNPAILDTFQTNLLSFQKSYNGLTYKAPMYASLKEEILKKLERVDN